MYSIEHQKFNKRNKIFESEESIFKVIMLYKEGKSSIEIGKMFNCSKHIILEILKSKNITIKKAHHYPSHKSKNQFGKFNPTWKGGTKSVYDRLRGLSKYWNWHNSILERDCHTCKNCGSMDKLEVHHIKSLKILVLEYSKLHNIIPINFTEQDLLSEHFYDISNGVTYCKKCHRDWHKINGR